MKLKKYGKATTNNFDFKIPSNFLFEGILLCKRKPHAMGVVKKALAIHKKETGDRKDTKSAM